VTSFLTENTETTPLETVFSEQLSSLQQGFTKIQLRLHRQRQEAPTQGELWNLKIAKRRRACEDKGKCWP
jgi:hypothetical protein